MDFCKILYNNNIGSLPVIFTDVLKNLFQSLMVNPKGIDFSDWGLYFEQIIFLLERSKEKTYLFGLYFEQIFFCSSLRFCFISKFFSFHRFGYTDGLFTGLNDI